MEKRSQTRKKGIRNRGKCLKQKRENRENRAAWSQILTPSILIRRMIKKRIQRRKINQRRSQMMSHLRMLSMSLLLEILLMILKLRTLSINLRTLFLRRKSLSPIPTIALCQLLRLQRKSSSVLLPR